MFCCCSQLEGAIVPLLKTFGAFGTVRPTVVAEAGHTVGSSGQGASLGSARGMIQAAGQLLNKLDSYPGLVGLHAQECVVPAFCRAVSDVMVSGAGGASQAALQRVA